MGRLPLEHVRLEAGELAIDPRRRAVSGFAWHWSFAWSILPELISGLKLTMIATMFGSIIAVCVGLILCLVTLARIPVLSAACSFWIQLVRGTPLLVQLYFIFYVAPTWGLTFSTL